MVANDPRFPPPRQKDVVQKENERIVFLQKQLLEAECVITLLEVAGLVSKEKVEQARDLARDVKQG